MIAEELRSERLVLRCLDDTHVTETYLSWMRDPEVNRFLESGGDHTTVESLATFVQDMRASTHSYLFGIFTRADGIHRGNIKIGPISSAHDCAAIGIIIGDRSTWGRGLATEAISMLSDWAFDTLGLHKLWAGAYDVNRGSISAFEKNGYVVEGVQKSQVKLSPTVRTDVVLLGKTRP